jgi:hypothetical protein
MEKYTLDPEHLNLSRLQILVESGDLIPGRMALKENAAERFRLLYGVGIRHMGQLLESLSNQQKIRDMAVLTGIPESYLALLKREAGSYLKKPFPLSEFPGIPFEYTEVLKSKGIRNTRDFFESAQESLQRDGLARLTGIPASRLKEILSLCDLSRITGVGGLYARILYLAGIRSVKAFAMTDPRTHRKKVAEVTERYGYRAIRLSLKDIRYCLDHAAVIVETSRV